MPTIPCKIISIPLALAAMILQPSLPAAAFTNVTIGLTDTPSVHYATSSIEVYNPQGDMGIHSRFYDKSTGKFLGLSAWAYNGGTLKQTGLVDAEHSTPSGQQRTAIRSINNLGQMIGDSTRYNETGGNHGTSAWLYSGGITTRIGLLGEDYTNNRGLQKSYTYSLNNTGQVLGASERYDINSTASLGRVAWLYDGGATTTMGLYDIEHTGSNGYQYSSANHLNEVGQVAGVSSRYDSNTGSYHGTSTWLYSNGTTTRIGLVDAEHTRSNGYQSSNLWELNEAGQVAGTSYRYNNPIRGINGYSTWLYSNGTTTRIGLVDAEHTGSYGYQHSTLRKLNEAGQVAGTSVRYDSNTGSYHGSSAWLYHNDTTTRIGFADAQHTDQNGYQDSSIQALNGAGQVAGTSSRYDSITGSNIGRSAWLYHNDTTTRVGLVDAGHTGNNGTQISQIQALNDAGQAAGFSTQYDSTTGNSIGNTTWLFDSTLEQTFIIDVTAQPNGSSNSTIHYLGDDGLVLGYYKKYSSDGIFRNNSPFAFTIEDGFVDLLDLAQQGTAQAAWGTLEQVYWNQDHSKVLGFRFTSGATLANTVIPIPASLWLFGSGLVGLMAVSRRKSNTGKHPEQGS